VYLLSFSARDSSIDIRGLNVLVAHVVLDFLLGAGRHRAYAQQWNALRCAHVVCHSAVLLFWHTPGTGRLLFCGILTMEQYVGPRVDFDWPENFKK